LQYILGRVIRQEAASDIEIDTKRRLQNALGAVEPYECTSDTVDYHSRTEADHKPDQSHLRWIRVLQTVSVACMRWAMT
jgi:hypothetical protein